MLLMTAPLRTSGIWKDEWHRESHDYAAMRRI